MPRRFFRFPVLSSVRPLRVRSARRLRIEALEPRQLLSVTSTGNEVLVNDYLHGPQRLVAEARSIAAMPDGGFAVAYQGRGLGDTAGVFLRQFSATGAPAGEAVLVNTTIDGNQVAPSIAASAGGQLVVVWDGRGVGDRQGIFMQRLTADGVPIGEETLVNTTVGGVQRNARVAVSAAGFVVVWEGNGVGDFDGVFVQRFDSEGNRLGDEQRVNTTTTSEQAFADVAMRADGSFVVTFSSRHQDGSDWGVYAQRFAADGTRVGSEVLVNTTTAGSQQQSSVAIGSDGDFTIAWSSIGQDGDGWGVYARHFLVNGNTDGGEIQVNVTTAGQQQDAKVARASDGTWFVTWKHGVPDGSGWEVRGRVIAVSAGSSGSELQINQGSTGPNSGHQENPSVASTTDGGFVVAFNGVGQQDRDGVYAQRLTPNSEPVNLPPQLDPIADQQATVGQQLSVTVHATDPNPGDVLTFFLDDQSPASATIEQTDNNTAIVRWTPTAADLPGPATIVVLVVDNGTPALADSESFEVIVQAAPAVNSPPNLAAIPDQTIAVAEQLALTVTATDPNPGDVLTFLLDADNSPPGATIESTGAGSAIIRWTPSAGDTAAPVPFRVLVVDSGSPSMADSESFVVHVVNQVPGALMSLTGHSSQDDTSETSDQPTTSDKLAAVDEVFSQLGDSLESSL